MINLLQEMTITAILGNLHQNPSYQQQQIQFSLRIENTCYSIVRNNKFRYKYWMDRRLQQLQQDGIDMVKYTTKNGAYRECPECQVTFSLEKQLPVLLKCGHVCCQSCATQGQKICFVCCNKKNIKMKQYTLYLQPIPIQKYGISISIQGQQQEHNIQDVPGDNTVQAVLKYYKGFNQFFQKTREGQILVDIGTKRMEYKKIKQTAIENYLKPSANQKNIKIRISLKENRSYGGDYLK